MSKKRTLLRAKFPIVTYFGPRLAFKECKRKMAQYRVVLNVFLNIYSIHKLCIFLYLEFYIIIRWSSCYFLKAKVTTIHVVNSVSYH